MRKCILKISILCFLSTVFIDKSFGQTASGDSTYVQTTLAQTTANFDKSIGEQSRLYNGHEYLPYDRHIKGNALFPYNADTWEPAEVNFDGIVYKNVPIMYDIYKDVVVVLLYNKFSMFALRNSKVHDFTFSNHHFVRVETDSLNNTSGISTGFYDQLYGGKIEILARRSKTIQNSSTTTATLETSFISSNDYYLKKGDNYYKIGSQSSLLNALKDKKSALQQYIKSNSIGFRDDPEDAMTKIASYYDHLAN